MENNRLIVIAAFLFVAIVVLVAANYGLLKIGGTTQQGYNKEFAGVVLPAKPELSGTIVDNPDFDFIDYGWLSADPRNIEKESKVQVEKTKWVGNGGASDLTYFGRNGTIIIHPFDTTESRYVEQTVTLPVGKTYYLVFGLANVGKYRGPTGCNDNVFRVSTTDRSTNSTDVLFEDELNTNDGWKDYMVGISKYSGKEITIRVDGISGGICGPWAGEWGAVDYVDVLPSSFG